MRARWCRCPGSIAGLLLELDVDRAVLVGCDIGSRVAQHEVSADADVRGSRASGTSAPLEYPDVMAGAVRELL